MLEIDGARFLIDPVFSERVSPIRHLGPRRVLGKMKVPASPVPREVDCKSRAFASAVLIPALNAVALCSQKLDEVHVDVRANPLRDGFSNIERTDAV